MLKQPQTNQTDADYFPFFSILVTRSETATNEQNRWLVPVLICFDTVSWANQAAAVSAFGIKKRKTREGKHSSLTWQVPASVSVLRSIHPLSRCTTIFIPAWSFSAFISSPFSPNAQSRVHRVLNLILFFFSSTHGVMHIITW